MQNITQSPDDPGLADARYPLQEHVPASEQAEENTPDHPLIAHDDLGDLIFECFESTAKILDPAFQFPELSGFPSLIASR